MLSGCASHQETPQFAGPHQSHTAIMNAVKSKANHSDLQIRLFTGYNQQYLSSVKNTKQWL